MAKRGVVGVAPAVDEAGFEVRLLHGPADGGPAAVDHDRTHADRLHEHNVHQQVPQRLRVLHHTAAQLDDGHLPAEAADPAHRLDQDVGFTNGYFGVFNQTEHSVGRALWGCWAIENLGL